MPRRAIRVAFVDSADALGGAENYLLLLLCHLDRQLVDPLLVCNPGKLQSAARALGIETRVVAMPRLKKSLHAPLDLVQGRRALAALVRAEGADILVSNVVRASFYAARALPRVPLVWLVHDILPDGIYVRAMARCARLAIPVSRAAAEPLPATLRQVTLPNYIDLAAADSMIASTISPRGAWGVSAASPLIGMAGSMRPWKGHSHFIRAMARVHGRYPDARFVVIGGDIFGLGSAYEQELQSLARQLGLARALVFAGQREDIYACMHACDVLVHCSAEPEAFGRVIIEGMASAVPIVAYNKAGPGEIVQDGHTGFLVPFGYTEALASASMRLLQDPALAREMGRCGREVVETSYNIRVGAQRFAEALLSLV